MPRAASLSTPPRSSGQSPRLPALWTWAISGFLIGCTIALLVYAPAQWLADGIFAVTQGQVQLRQARGTVWSGSAQLVLTGGPDSRDSAALPGRLEWTVRLGWTKLYLQTHSKCCMAEAPLRATIEPGLSNWRFIVEDGRMQWPAELLIGLGTPWNTIQPSGSLTLSSKALAVTWTAGRFNMDGQVQLEAINMASRLSTLRPMGSYQLIVQGGTSPTMTLSTLTGDLQLRGSGTWVGGRLRFQGEASAAPEREAALANLLNIIGRRQGGRSIITVG